jgi:hypothetical protein
MQAQELYVKVGEEFKGTGKFFCASCRMTNVTKEAAEACCVCEMCKEQPPALHRIYCDECLEKHDAERDAEEKAKRQVLFDAAEEVTEWEFVWYDEKCCQDLAEIRDDCMYDDKDVPEFVFAMKKVNFGGFDSSRLFDDFDENEMCEDLYCKDVLFECDVLEEAIKAFNETNKDRTIYWEEDTSRKVRVPREEESE